MLNEVIRTDLNMSKKHEMKSSLASFDFVNPAVRTRSIKQLHKHSNLFTPSPLTDYTLNTPDFNKFGLKTPDMDMLLKEPLSDLTPFMHSPNAIKLFESINTPNSLFSTRTFLGDQNSTSNGQVDEQAGRSTASSENSNQSLVIDDKSNDRLSNSDENRSLSSDKSDQDKAADDSLAVILNASRLGSNPASQTDTSNSLSSMDSQSNSPSPPVSTARRAGFQLAGNAVNGPFMGAHNGYAMAPFCQMANQPNGLAIPPNHFPSSTFPALPPNHNLITNPPRMPPNYPTQMPHLSPYPAMQPNFPFNPHTGYTINNHFFNNQMAILNRPSPQPTNAAANKPRNQAVKENGSSSSSSSDEQAKRAKKADSSTDDVDEKKRRRNREAAERCRKRKLERFNNLEEQCNQYRDQLNQANMMILRLNQKCQQLEHQWNQHISMEGCKLTEKLANER